MMNIKHSNIPDVLILEPKVFSDDRGYFLETFRKSHFENHGLNVEFIQDNSSMSTRGTVRGLHYQKTGAAQAKLMSVIVGKILDVAVDLRAESPTFGQHVAVELSEQNHRQLYIPEGFAHGFSVLSDKAVIHYKCSAYYNSELERGIRWDDPTLGIDWKVEKPLLSDKDHQLPLLGKVSREDLF